MLSTKYTLQNTKHKLAQKYFLVAALLAFCKQARDTLTTDSAESQFVKTDKTDHYSLLMRPGSSFYVMLVGFMSSSPSLEILSQSMHLLDVTVNIYCAFSAVDVLTILCYALSYLSLCGCVHQLILHLNIDKSAENTTRLEDACKGTRDYGDKKSSNWQTINPFTTASVQTHHLGFLYTCICNYSYCRGPAD